MPRKRYDDEELRRRALALRRRGYSYREIACELGCSLYKVWEVLSPVESPRSRLRQAAELVARVEELSGRLQGSRGSLTVLRGGLGAREGRRQGWIVGGALQGGLGA